MSAWTDKIIPINKYSRSGQKLTAVRKLIIHWTANPGATAENHYNYFKNLRDRYASAHLFVDKAKALCIIPLNEVAYQANDGSYRGISALKPNANYLAIGVEMCVEKNGTFHPDTIRRTEDVMVELCKRYKLNPLTDIVRHYDVTHKNCPAPWVSNSKAFVDFKNRVNAKMKGINQASKPTTPTGELYRVRKTWADEKSQIGAYSDLKNAIAEAKKKSGYKVFNNKGAQVYPELAKPTPAPTPKNLYRVRKSWTDEKSQIGAFGDKQNAIDLAKTKSGYNVYDDKGNQVYPEKAAPKPKPTEKQLYRVRKSWNDADSQIGAFADLANAKELASSKAGYSVFDKDGKLVFKPTEVKKEITHKVEKGDTLWSISQKYNVTVEELQKRNKLDGNLISVGQVLSISGDKIVEASKPKEEPKPTPPTPEKPKEDKPVVDEHKGHTDIMGKSKLSCEQMASFVKEVGKNTEINIMEIAEAFLKVGEKYGVKGDVAFAQSIIETGWFKFEGGTAVTPDQHNYCGMGVTSKGMKGNSFKTVEEGVTAQIQHLFAYSTKNEIPKGEEIVDPRFKYVTRGIAPHWDDLSGRWAMNDTYHTQIFNMYERMSKHVVVDESDSTDDKNNDEISEKGKKLVDYLIERLGNLFGKKK